MRPPEQFEAVLRVNLVIAEDQPLDYGTPLADYGLDSLTAVNITVDLEQQFNVIFPDEKIMHSIFSTAQSLWDTLSDVLAEDEARSGESRAVTIPHAAAEEQVKDS